MMNDEQKQINDKKVRMRRSRRIQREKWEGKNWLFSFMPFILLAFVYSISMSIGNNSVSFEKYYAQGLNKWMIELVSVITGVFNFSIGEFVLYGHVLALPIVAMILLVKIFKGGFFRSVFRIIQYISILYVVFMVMWGFNYERQSVADTMGFEVRPYTKEELVELTTYLVDEANRLRPYQSLSDEGVMMVPGGYKQIFARASDGYTQLSKRYQFLSGLYGKPKPILASAPMLYTGITGVYFPYTSEANVNIEVPDLLLPATTLHEMAHQRGIAPEDEANFIAYLAATAHPDKDFQYSGTILALIHTMNALYALDADEAMRIRSTYSDGVSEDIISYSRFWDDYRGKTTEVADQVNDTYLKTNRQEDGVRSYGKMVDLLLGYYLEVAKPQMIGGK
ncbi:DUF3810 domain-containing protein [Fusibacter bizertensis]|uniref:DUF3810 domain-containing protein n=1 Tax=Fusibacter bizertensis TaxID=1488331 RepID=A0ABT6NH69_9FIRM|nr:DUF3810 domain-containing protein [Fusibacter bizertensis]MDH8679690.1 DUF3810 domain-containing protein [Fusibacter bizertensis]